MTLPQSFPFNVRVYGICFNDKRELLVTDEIIRGQEVTKFPGGGLEFGEGTIEGLKREFVEETGNDVEVLEHFYTTDFFVKSAYGQAQVISIYYLCKLIGEPIFKVKMEKFSFPERKNDVFVFRWIPLTEVHPDEFTLPIDKVVAGRIRSVFSKP